MCVALSAFLFSWPAPAKAQKPAFNYLCGQLDTITSFEELQNPQNAAKKELATVKDFLKFYSKAPTDYSDQNTDSLINFLELVYDKPENELGRKIFRSFALSAKLINKNSDAENAPFLHHVKEAIEVNKKRAEYYAKVSNNRSKPLSRKYIMIERSIVPTAIILDMWARALRRQGIPALAGDFSSMRSIFPANKAPARRGKLPKEAISHYKELLKQYRSKVFSAVRQKDFIRIQLLSMAALHSLKKLELKHNCHLALSIHLIESIGLGARNADRLSQKFNGKADNFYRANLFMQTLGVKLFSSIDLKAQSLHECGIGIIVNDLPAIPFP